jgi:precorrin-2 dehydrogenase / sirohydrochlorin ferrochelatase
MTPSDPVYPVSLVVAGKRCLVVGGGKVAGRKTRSLLECRAAVTMVAPEVHEALAMLSSDGTIASIEDTPLDVQLREYRPGEAANYRLVVTATGVAEVDRMVSRDAQAAGVWVNSADDPANCTFLLPAVVRRGPVSVAVSTSGASPALASWLRRRIAGDLPVGIEDLAYLLEEARTLVHENGSSTESIDWQSLLDGPIVGLVAAGRIDEARRILRTALIQDPPEESTDPTA